MAALLDAMADAESANQADTWGFGGSFADMAEHSALARAQANVNQLQLLMQRARNLSVHMGGLGPMKIAEGYYMSDMLFDNVLRTWLSIALFRRARRRLCRIVGY